MQRGSGDDGLPSSYPVPHTMNEKPKIPRVNGDADEQTPDSGLLGEDEVTKAGAPDSKLLVEAGRPPRAPGGASAPLVPREESED